MLQFLKHRCIFVTPHPLDKREFIVDDGADVEMLDVQLEARNSMVAGCVQHFGGPQKRLGWDAPDVHTRTAERRAGVHERSACAQLVRLDGRAESSGTAADDDQIVLLRATSWRSRPT
jgi:hypothetical protein